MTVPRWKWLWLAVSGCVVADQNLPHFSGLQALDSERKRLRIPFFIVSGSIEESLAAEGHEGRSQDYVMNRTSRALSRIERDCAKSRSAGTAKLAEATVEHQRLRLLTNFRTAPLKDRLTVALARPAKPQNAGHSLRGPGPL